MRVVIAQCSVDYVGRLTAHLPLATRLLMVKADGSVFIQETQIPVDEIGAKLAAIATTGYTERIHVRGDGEAPYGMIADVMARMQAAGYTNVGLITEQKTN